MSYETWEFKPMEYKGYRARLDYDDEDQIFYGSVMDCGLDIISFKGHSVQELRQEFADSVDAYLGFCEELKGSE